mgnify:CR=1 FL=1
MSKPINVDNFNQSLVVGQKLVDVDYDEQDNELILMFEDGRRIEIFIHDDGTAHIETD